MLSNTTLYTTRGLSVSGGVILDSSRSNKRAARFLKRLSPGYSTHLRRHGLVCADSGCPPRVTNNDSLLIINSNLFSR